MRLIYSLLFLSSIIILALVYANFFQSSFVSLSEENLSDQALKWIAVATAFVNLIILIKKGLFEDDKK